MPDGKRKRRWNGEARRRWYAAWRSARFNRRFGTIRLDDLSLAHRLIDKSLCRS